MVIPKINLVDKFKTLIFVETKKFFDKDIEKETN